MSLLLQLREFGVALRRDGLAPLPLVSGVNLELHEGGVALLLGESGSGKTSLLHALAGLCFSPRFAMQGRATLSLDQLRHELPRKSAQLRGAGMALLPQDPGSGLDPAQRALDVVREVQAAGALPQAAAQWLAALGLEASVQRLRAHELSVGMRQRVQLAAVLAAQPRLLLLDEPTSALDRGSAALLAKALQTQRARGMALLVATHDLHFAKLLDGFATVLCGGCMVEQRAFAQLLAHPRHPLSRAFFSAARGEMFDVLLPPPPVTALTQGCVFAERCALMQPSCRKVQPLLDATGLACPVVARAEALP